MDPWHLRADAKRPRPVQRLRGGVRVGVGAVTALPSRLDHPVDSYDRAAAFGALRVQRWYSAH
ncbi:MAG TPA: hypothetical protein VFM01_03280 [Nakamurella sp.]|nr:hypothetical protein [Nakamurella sp.]